MNTNFVNIAQEIAVLSGNPNLFKRDSSTQAAYSADDKTWAAYMENNKTFAPFYAVLLMLDAARSNNVLPKWEKCMKQAEWVCGVYYLPEHEFYGARAVWHLCNNEGVLSNLRWEVSRALAFAPNGNNDPYAWSAKLQNHDFWDIISLLKEHKGLWAECAIVMRFEYRQMAKTFKFFANAEREQLLSECREFFGVTS